MKRPYPADIFETIAELELEEDGFESDFEEEWQGEVNRKSAEYIRWVQSSLNRIMGVRLAVDGIIGSQTRSAIRSFQQQKGLTVDGIVGSQTERALIAAGASSPPSAGAGGASSTNGSTSSASSSSATTGDMPLGPFGNLIATTPKQIRFSYSFTPEDVLWTARFIVGEAGGRDDAENRAVIWAMFNRYAFFTHGVYPTFHQFIRAYSTPLQLVLKSWGAAKRHMHKPEFVRTGGNYAPPHDNIPRGQLRRFLELQAKPWRQLAAGARTLAEQALRGQVQNPIGNASEFGSTYVYFHDAHGRYPNDDEWRKYTEAYANRKRWIWIGAVPNLNQKKNAFFIDRRAASLSPNSVRVIPATANSSVPADFEDFEFDGEEEFEDFEFRPRGGTQMRPGMQRKGSPAPPPKPSPRTPGHWLTPFTSSAIPKYKDKNGQFQPTACSVYVPDAAWKEKTIDLLVFFHGDPGPCSAMFNPDPKNNSKKFGLDAQIHGSGRKVALAVPMVHWIAGTSANVLGVWTAANLNKFVEEALDEIGRRSGVKPTLGRLIIAGHSHAHAILTPLAREFNQGAPATKTGALAKLDEVWALDSTYGQQHVRALEAWASALPKARFIAALNKTPAARGKNPKPIDGWNSYYKACSFKFSPPPNLRICTVDEGHCAIPTKHIGKLLSTTRSSPDWCRP